MKAEVIKEYNSNDYLFEVGEIIDVIVFKEFNDSYAILQDTDLIWIPKNHVKITDK